MGTLRKLGIALLSLGLMLLLWGAGLYMVAYPATPYLAAGVVLLVVGAIARWSGMRADARRARRH
jgi:hypothetical protein